jgi:phosphatidylserine decarboxylase
VTHDVVPQVSPDLPTPGWRFTLGLLKRLPQGALSRGFGQLADTPIPRLMRRSVLGAFARAVGINAGEAELPLEQYGSLNDFFVRRLKPGARAWSADPAVAGSPVDGVVGQLGIIEKGTLMQAKGRSYSAAALLADAESERRYEGGCYITIYLSPRHYHRIHAPVAGRIARAVHLPGYLLPVNAPSVSHVADLFAVNERLVCYEDSGLGRIAVVAVGAYNVGRITAAFDPGLRTNRKNSERAIRTYEPPVPVAAGDEIMAFHLGSTIVALFEPGVRLKQDIVPGADVVLGQPIAHKWPAS